MKRFLLSVLLLVGMATTGIAQTQTIIGDVNRDGQLTIADVTALVNVLLGKAPMQYIYTNPVTDVSLNRTTLLLAKDFTATLTATVAPANALVQDITWTTSDASVATVSESGVVTAVGKGTATITATTLDGGKAATCKVTVIEPEYVEMAPGFYWATMNVGAASPEEYGDYFAWGETQPKSYYSWDNYAFGTKDNLTKYNNSDYKEVLEPEDDAATQNWGNDWRMPTHAEWANLCDTNNYTWTWTTDYEGTGISGYIVTSNVTGYVGNQIFLPTGYYWSSNLFSLDLSTAFHEYFLSDEVDFGTIRRCLGRFVRPIYSPHVYITGISLDHETCTVLKGRYLTLTATITPDDASDKRVTWTSSNSSVATVSQEGVVAALAVGKSTITATTVDGGYTATCEVTVDPEPEYVEMAPGFYWATTNVGAATPEEYGDYFAWGETEPKSNYTWDTYAFGTQDNLTKYNGSDGKTALDSEDDAATQNWGGYWRMPTEEEWRWLKENCTWTWTDDYNGTGVAGDIVTSNVSGYENKSIFLPAEGYRYGASPYYAGSNGRYWSSTYSSNTYAWGLQFSSSGVGMGLHNRFNGQCVRPVYDPTNVPKFVEMGDGLKWATMNVGANKPEDYGDYFAWGETEPYYESIGEDGTVTWKDGKSSGYDWTSYFDTNDGSTFTTYYSGGGKTVLEAGNDAATANWGSEWRIPTYAEWANLCDTNKYTWSWTINYNSTGVAGCIITSKVPGYIGNQIFLPAAGYRHQTSFDEAGVYGSYWSSSLYTNISSSKIASFIQVSSDEDSNRSWTGNRPLGLSVRAVSE